ncbi:MAG: DUF1788 domain-containing protein [Actinobacteria bacterium]|nr:DUF1788 domain-containing protein [Actinomycetota bacterium]
MPVWDDQRFKKLLDRILATVAGKRPVIDVPYYVYVYEPALEQTALDEFEKLEAMLRAKGVSVETISLATWMIDSLESLGCLAEAFLKQEAKQRDWVKQDLERELTREISSRLKEHLKDKDISHCALFVRAGALFPFVRVSSILSSIEAEVHATIVVAYPGSRDGTHLRFLNEGDGVYYRAEII